MAIIVIGVATFFKSTSIASQYLKSFHPNLEIVPKIVQLISQDIRCSLNPPKLSVEPNGEILTIETTNSLMFSGAKPVIVSYYVSEDEKGQKLLFRKEIDKDSDQELILPLTSKVEDITFEFYSNNVWQKNPTNVVKVILTIEHKKYEFAARGVTVE